MSEESGNMFEDRWKSNPIFKIFDKFVDTTYCDLHIGVRYNYVRERVWNIKNLWFTLTNEIVESFAKQILSKERFSILMTGEEVDYWFTHKNARFRLNFYYDNEWLNIAARRIESNYPDLSALWLPEVLNKHFLKQKWLILITWPTGTWKSTTMAWILNFIAESRKCHILTLEDPIEYIISSNNSLIHQREVGRNTKSWVNWIKYALRQDPDVVVVWEMRDLPTIEWVLTLVETWHLVISTLHTIDAVQTITRVINSFPSNQQNRISLQLSMVLEMAISQRLVPRKDGTERYCVREVLINNTAIANLIRTWRIPSIYWVLETQRKAWMTTMDNDMALAVVNDMIDIKDALPLVKDLWTFKQMVLYYQDEKERRELYKSKDKDE